MRTVTREGVSCVLLESKFALSTKPGTQQNFKDHVFFKEKVNMEKISGDPLHSEPLYKYRTLPRPLVRGGGQ